MKHIDLIGRRFGKLKVIEKLPHTERQYKYKCVCDCGNVIEAKSENLRSGRVKSCGCLKHREAVNRIENREDAILKREYSSIRKRNRKFANNENVIDFEDYKSIVTTPCHFCGSVGSKSIYDKLRSRGVTHSCSDIILHINGIDRIDSSKGYIKGNCVSCCTTCNYAKNTMTIEQFKKWIKQVYEHYCK